VSGQFHAPVALPPGKELREFAVVYVIFKTIRTEVAENKNFGKELTTPTVFCKWFSVGIWCR